MAEFSLIKHLGGVWLPATEVDHEATAQLPIGTLFTGKGSGRRNVRFHRKFFSLLNLGFDYWEPAGGLVTPAETRVVRAFVKFLGKWAALDALTRAADAFLDHLERHRAERFPAPAKSFEAYRKWVVEEAGFYDLITLPDGSVRKQAHSIKFSKMTEHEFSELYKAAFGVIWRHVLVNTFASEDEAEAAVNQMMGYV